MNNLARNSRFNLVTILGPTAVGKTGLAARLALKFNGEIISADSRQVYKGMDIGTGKDIDEYVVDGNKIEYHLIDIIEPAEEFNLFLFQSHFFKAFAGITERGKLPFLVGGTGMYLHSVLSDYRLKRADFDAGRRLELNSKSVEELREILFRKNKLLHNTTDLIEKERIIRAIIVTESADEPVIEREPLFPIVIGVRMEREIVKKRITERLKLRLQNGMIEEVKKLIDGGITFDKLDFFGLEYKFIGRHLKGELNYNDMFQKLNSAIHDFAKRQMTWFRKMEKEGIKINWIEGPDFNAASEIIEQNLFLK